MAEPEQYRALIKHELSHAFYNILSKGEIGPVWLREGVAVYASGQNRYTVRPSAFNKCLEFYHHEGKEVYVESGYVIQLLVDTFGKEKLFDLVRNTKDTKSPEEFSRLFESIYGHAPTYALFNELNHANNMRP